LNLKEHWKNVEYFDVFVHFEGEDTKALLDESALEKLAKLKFKNNFKNMQFKEYPIPGFNSSKEEIEKINAEMARILRKSATIFIKIWAVGTDYPISFNMEFTLKTNDSEIFRQEILGYTYKSNFEDTARNFISHQMEDCAVKFFEARGEL